MDKTHNSLLAIDLGNSSTSYGVFRGRRLLRNGYVPDGNIPKLVRLLAKSGGLSSTSSVIVSSVVPYLTVKLKKALFKILGEKRVFILGRNLKVSLPSKYDRKTLGMDRLVNVYGAIRRYRLPVLVIDFGTAITFDYVSKRGIFEGGLIVPGPRLAARALEEHTALLPKLTKIKPVRTLLGRNTKTAMYSGLLNGLGALSDGLVERCRKQYGPKLTVVATGGFATRIAPYARLFDYVDPLHTVKSLALIYENEVRKKLT